MNLSKLSIVVASAMLPGVDVLSDGQQVKAWLREGGI